MARNNNNNKDNGILSSSAKSRKHSLLTDSVGTTIYRTTVPTTIGAIALILYYLADTYFVSMLGTAPLAALGFTFPATIMITYFGVGLGIGTSALVARAIGSNNQEQAAELTFASILIALLVGVLAIFPSLWIIDLLFPAMGATDDLMPFIKSFLGYWVFGIPFLLIQFAGTSVIRAGGNARLHGIMMMAGAGLNTILDPILIFGFGPFPEMGIAGAALATVITWGLGIIVICWYLWSQERLLVFQLPTLRSLLSAWKKLMKITLPAACANMITPLATGVITVTLAGYGTLAVAAYSVVSRLEALILIVVLGMSMSLPPFISQNFGAKRFDRVQEGLRLSLKFVVVLQLCLYLLVALTAPFIATLFTDDQQIRDIITLVLRILPASYAFQGMVVLSASCFNALHAPRNALFSSLLRFFVFYVPLALLGSHLAGIKGLFIGAAIGNVLAGLVVSRWIIRFSSNLENV